MFGCRDRVVPQGRHVHLQHPTRREETARASSSCARRRSVASVRSAARRSCRWGASASRRDSWEAVARNDQLGGREPPAIRPSESPGRARAPAASAGSGGSSSSTVEPMLKRPSSAPRAWKGCGGAERLEPPPRGPSPGGGAPGRARGDLSVPDGRHAADEQRPPEPLRRRRRSPSNRHTSRSLRANSRGTRAAVAAFTENSLPGTCHAARSVPAAACARDGSDRARGKASRSAVTKRAARPPASPAAPRPVAMPLGLQ